MGFNSRIINNVAMKKKIIKLRNIKDILWIFLVLSFFQIVLLPFLRNLFLDSLYKPMPIKEINLILKKVCTREEIKNVNEDSFIYNLCNEKVINYFRN